MQGLLPALEAEAPLVARSQTGKLVLRNWSDEVVATRLRKEKKFLSDDHANEVHSGVVREALTAAIAYESGEGIVRAGSKIVAKNVERHRR